MGQDVLVSEQIEDARRLLREFLAAGLDIPLAFWAKQTERRRWELHIVSPAVDEHGPTYLYRLMRPIIENHSDLDVDPRAIAAIGVKDSLAIGAAAAVEPSPSGRGTRLGETDFAGIEIDGAYIYPPLTAMPTA